MKAERRHELQTNTLDQALTRAPEAARKYGGMALLVVLAVAAGFLLIRYRISSAREAERAARENLATARTSIDQLGRLQAAAVQYGVPPPQLAEFRKRYVDDARMAIDAVAGSAGDPRLLAEALLAKGDLNWAMAQLDELPGAATQPSLRLDADRNTLLGQAESAYTEVITQYGEQRAAVAAANFGLGAVYETQGHWDNARQKYQQIVDDANVSEAYRTLAKTRLERTAEWSRPVLLAAATQPAAGPGLNSANAPTTATASITTKPSTAPTTAAVER